MKIKKYKLKIVPYFFAFFFFTLGVRTCLPL